MRAGRCPYADVGVVSWIGGIQVSTQRIEGRQRTAPTRPCTRTRVVLHRGLDGMLSVMSAQPAEWAVRGFIVELLAWYLVWRSDDDSRAAAAEWRQRGHDATKHEQTMWKW
jgi:hypothetical protein